MVFLYAPFNPLINRPDLRHIPAREISVIYTVVCAVEGGVTVTELAFPHEYLRGCLRGSHAGGAKLSRAAVWIAIQRHKQDIFPRSGRQPGKHGVAQRMRPASNLACVVDIHAFLHAIGLQAAA